MESMLSTIDNPYDPFTQFDEWYAYDESMGYHTCGYIARIVKSSEELSEADQEVAIGHAIDEIINLNVFGNYIIKYKNKENK